SSPQLCFDIRRTIAGSNLRCELSAIWSLQWKHLCHLASPNRTTSSVQACLYSSSVPIFKWSYYLRAEHLVGRICPRSFFFLLLLQCLCRRNTCPDIPMSFRRHDPVWLSN